MKYLSKIVFAIMLSLTFFACSEERIASENQDSVANIELLKIDARYSELIKH